MAAALACYILIIVLMKALMEASSLSNVDMLLLLVNARVRLLL